ncbi:ABC transporter substrate-binding protein [Aestuariivita sp.]|jgi:iron complex transport system substrate-binding protein|uniref:heme/hemin ABC transporter substrate-binding protein n=1 Tax=Aestuariivita sp. TaxID=1872407 RepID=UPI00216BB296|nr:ABC transporter substrate-binding protein [Aestuariivita sp.]MCE8006146.1 ABC transporter substrate-binding protein [Aestuariivita sp.]
MRANRRSENGLFLAVALTVFWGAAIALWISAEQAYSAPSKKANVVAIGGSVTEIVYALGQEHRLVARDTTSTYPPQAQDLPDVGYVRALSPEGVLSVSPELIITEGGAGPPEAVEVLEAAQIEMVTVPNGYSREAVVAKIRAVGEALDVATKANALADRIDADLRAAEAKSAAVTDAPKRVLFILSTQGGRILASGTGTAADGIIRMAGGQNAMTQFEGYKPVTAEAIAAAAPDVVLMMDRDGNHSVEDDVLFSMPAMQTTPAAANDAIIRMNGLLLLGFGPRTAEAVTQLNRQLYDG